MFKKIRRISHFFYYFFQIYEIFFSNLPRQTNKSVDEICFPYIVDNKNTVSLDLGCGSTPVNPFKSSSVFGLDMFDDDEQSIQYCSLGYEDIPFPDEHFNFITAFDLIEHIPRFNNINKEINSPFIHLMNEIWRVLKEDGIFLSHTPIYPFPEAFQDPTHNNIITSNTFRQYFSNEKHPVAESYGICSDFKILEEYMKYRHQVMLLKKINTST